MLRSSLSPFVAAAVLAISPLVAPPAAAAPEPTPSEISVARRLFDEGKAAEDAGRFRDAADKFRKAISIKDTPGMRFHLARCEEEQGALVEALLEYDRAKELLDSGVKAADVERLLPEARARVQSRVASLTLRLPEGVTEASVELDGKALALSVLGVAIPVNPGKHRLRALARGRTPFAAELDLGVGEAKQLVMELPAPAPESAPPRTPPLTAAPHGDSAASDSTSSDTLRTVALVSEAALFATGLSAGIVFSIVKSGASDRYDRANERVLSQVGGSDPEGTACAVPREGCAELEAARREEKNSGTIATLGFVGAGVSALAFGLTLALWDTGTPARVQAGVGPGRASVAFSTRF